MAPPDIWLHCDASPCHRPSGVKAPGEKMSAPVKRESRRASRLWPETAGTLELTPQLSAAAWGSSGCARVEGLHGVKESRSTARASSQPGKVFSRVKSDHFRRVCVQYASHTVPAPC